MAARVVVIAVDLNQSRIGGNALHIVNTVDNTGDRRLGVDNGGARLTQHEGIVHNALRNCLVLGIGRYGVLVAKSHVLDVTVDCRVARAAVEHLKDCLDDRYRRVVLVIRPCRGINGREVADDSAVCRLAANARAEVVLSGKGEQIQPRSATVAELVVALVPLQNSGVIGKLAKVNIDQILADCKKLVFYGNKHIAVFVLQRAEITVEVLCRREIVGGCRYAQRTRFIFRSGGRQRRKHKQTAQQNCRQQYGNPSFCNFLQGNSSFNYKMVPVSLYITLFLHAIQIS